MCQKVWDWCKNSQGPTVSREFVVRLAWGLQDNTSDLADSMEYFLLAELALFSDKSRLLP